MGNILGGCPCCTIFTFKLSPDFDTVIDEPIEDETVGTTAEKTAKLHRNRLRSLVTKETEPGWLRCNEAIQTQFAELVLFAQRSDPIPAGQSRPVEMEFELVDEDETVLISGHFAAVFETLAPYTFNISPGSIRYFALSVTVGSKTHDVIGESFSNNVGGQPHILARIVLTEFGVSLFNVVNAPVANPGSAAAMNEVLGANVWNTQNQFFEPEFRKRFFFFDPNANPSPRLFHFLLDDEHTGLFIEWPNAVKQTAFMRFRPIVNTGSECDVIALREKIRKPLSAPDAVATYRRKTCQPNEVAIYNAPSYTTPRWNVDRVETSIGDLEWPTPEVIDTGTAGVLNQFTRFADGVDKYASDRQILRDYTALLKSPVRGFYGDVSTHIDPTVRPQEHEAVSRITSPVLRLADGALTWLGYYTLGNYWRHGNVVTGSQTFSSFQYPDPAELQAAIDAYVAAGAPQDWEGGGTVTISDLWRNTRIYTRLVGITPTGQRTIEVKLHLSYLIVDPMDLPIFVGSIFDFGGWIHKIATVQRDAGNHFRYYNQINVAGADSATPFVSPAAVDGANYLYQPGLQYLVNRIRQATIDLTYRIDVDAWNGPPPTFAVDSTHLVAARYDTDDGFEDITSNFSSASPPREITRTVTSTVTGHISFPATVSGGGGFYHVTRVFENTGNLQVETTTSPLDINDFRITFAPTSDTIGHPSSGLVSVSDS